MLFLAAPNAPNDPNAPAPHAPWAGAEGAAHTEAIRPGPSDDITGTSLSPAVELVAQCELKCCVFSGVKLIQRRPLCVALETGPRRRLTLVSETNKNTAKWR